MILFSVIEITSRADAGSTRYLFCNPFPGTFVDSGDVAYQILAQEPQVGGSMPSGGRADEGVLDNVPPGYVGGVAEGFGASSVVLRNRLPNAIGENTREATWVLGAGLEGQPQTLYRIALRDGEAPPALSSGDYATTKLQTLTVAPDGRDFIELQVASATAILEAELAMERYRGMTDAAPKMDASDWIGWADVSSGGTHGWLYNIVTASEWVIEFLVYGIDLSTNNQQWLLWGDGVADGIEVLANGSGDGRVRLVCIGLSTDTVQTSKDVLSADRFNHVAVWRTATHIGIHVDGEESISSASTGTITVPGSNPPLDVGNTSSAVTFCELRFWDAKPSDEELDSRHDQLSDSDWAGWVDAFSAGASAIWDASSGTAARDTDRGNIVTADWTYGGEGHEGIRGKTHPLLLGTCNWMAHSEVNPGRRIADLGQAALSAVTVAMQGVVHYSPIDAQDETDYAAFAGGTGHSVSDVVTVTGGTTATVDAVSGGVVTQFTIDSTATSASSQIGDTLIQTATTGGGTGFSITVEAANLEANVVYATINSPHNGLVTIDNNSGSTEDQIRYQATGISIADYAALIDYLTFDSPGIGPEDSASKSSDFGAWLDQTGVGLRLPSMDDPPRALDELREVCAGAGVVLALDASAEWGLLRVPFTPFDMAAELDATLEAGVEAPIDGIRVTDHALEHPAKEIPAAYSPTEDPIAEDLIDFATLGTPPTGADATRVRQMQADSSREHWRLDPAGVAGDMLVAPIIPSRVQTAPEAEEIARLALPEFSERGARVFTAQLRTIDQAFMTLGSRVVLKDPEGHDTPAGGIPCVVTGWGGGGERFGGRDPRTMGDVELLEQRLARVAPTSIVSSSGLTAPTVEQVQDDPRAPSADFFTATGSVAASARLAFARTAADISLDDSVYCEFEIRVEVTGSSEVALTVWIEEDGGSVAGWTDGLAPLPLIGSGYDFGSGGSIEVAAGETVVVRYAWDPTALVALEDVEAYFEMSVPASTTAKVYAVGYTYRVSQRS